ncbi:hypothetical protein HBH50_185910 [Parastagonospora nodorum]|nr:hypothetical protein HBH50_185910 [Parastagonospora nodorum]KAH4932285.1 hypothetical protein HBI79_099680 [Parastagonospora nodorum]KAH5626859.1 hypothetical protein HBI22_148630 [Parastagonospora nodorum]KAH6435493.1 hypothetical protein HBI59_168790 [Parastagonospora nodorum]
MTLPNFFFLSLLLQLFLNLISRHLHNGASAVPSGKIFRGVFWVCGASPQFRASRAWIAKRSPAGQGFGLDDGVGPWETSGEGERSLRGLLFVFKLSVCLEED